MIKVLLVDDQMLFAQSLKMTIENYAKDISVAGIASNGSEAVDMAAALSPDVVLMDVYMKKMDGIYATKLIHQRFPDMKILMLSTYGDDDNVRQALIAGASGYLLKDVSPTELLLSIRSLGSGMIQISPDVVKKLLLKKYVEDDGHKPDEPFASLVKSLTRREREIFTFLATGYQNDMIARELNLTEQTVRNYVSTIYDKLGVKDRFEIIRLANMV